MWIYDTNEDNSARFTLGEYSNESKKTLLCFGVNPSTACPTALDNTVRKVKTLCANNGYANWIMLNIYPQRATQPKDLHLQRNDNLHKGNLAYITKVLKQFRNADILWAYGNLVDIRPYLKACLQDVIAEIKANDFQGKFQCIKVTKVGHPVHPLYQRNDSVFIDFNFHK